MKYTIQPARKTRRDRVRAAYIRAKRLRPGDTIELMDFYEYCHALAKQRSGK